MQAAKKIFHPLSTNREKIDEESEHFNPLLEKCENIIRQSLYDNKLLSGFEISIIPAQAYNWVLHSTLEIIESHYGITVKYNVTLTENEDHITVRFIEVIGENDYSSNGRKHLFFAFLTNYNIMEDALNQRMNLFVSELCENIGKRKKVIMSMQTNTDKSMLRSRPYEEGQPKRMQQQISGVTMRDLRDCFIRAVLLSTGGSFYCEKPMDMVLHTKLKNAYAEARKGEQAKLDINDLYGFDLDKLDPMAISQNLMCEIEKVMGIYPNMVDYDEWPPKENTIQCQKT